ncbi:S41 family peptidase [Lederbergia galactosidilytica]|uniref:C-terminal processing peptidase n=1 Tax=Lederbergia galactosidilytica TaxID=217031 RepID=A0A177ZJ19_9BACI|nr:S41 family peptidase [Lederbergia galactosidilytica]OAK67946.1 peptidase S41 [Lederbergia galactosidilytica]
MKKRWLVIISVCSFLLGAGGIYASMMWIFPNWQDPQSNQESGTVQILPAMEKVAEAYDLIQHAYVEEVDTKKLIQGAIQGMVATLQDPYSVYMDEETAERFNESMDSSFNGIGAQIAIQEGKLVIISPIKNSPAEKAGLKAKDQIIKIDGDSVDGLDLYEASSKIRGKKGTAVTLDIMRSGVSKSLNYEIVRDEVPILTVFSELKESGGKKFGYVEITSFAEGTAKDFEAELKELEAENIEGLVIDVRGNPGGMLISVQEILAQLVTGEKPYVQIEERSGKKQTYYSELEKEKGYPITVLIDEGSASASEILVAALNEINGTTLIGTKTFGKGTVQQPIPLEAGGNLKLTMAKWLTPDGNWIHGKGIDPTIEVQQPAYFNAHAIEYKEPLKLNMNDENIKFAQEMLKGLGFSPGRIDGYFDEQTEKAVRAFQSIEELPITGEIDEKTVAKLEGKIADFIKDEKNDIQLQVALKSLQKNN